MLTEALLVALIAAAPPGAGTARGAHRSGHSLVITLGTGREVVLEDKSPPEHEADVELFSYVRYLPSVHQHLVKDDLYEAYVYLAVDDRTGRVVRLAGPPVVSPDGLRLACSQDHPVGGVPSEIWRDTPAGLEREWLGGLDDGLPRWIDEATVAFETADAAKHIGLDQGVWETLLAGAPKRLAPCREHPEAKLPCFTVRGRLRFRSAGPPTMVIWIVGTDQMLGISEGRARPDVERLPANVAAVARLGTDVFGDFEFCPFDPRQPGAMQLGCLQAGHHLRTQPTPGSTP